MLLATDWSLSIFVLDFVVETGTDSVSWLFCWPLLLSIDGRFLVAYQLDQAAVFFSFVFLFSNEMGI